jgi:plasmid maintenance system antidote protein VapI
MTNAKASTISGTPLNHFPGDPNILLDALIDKLNLKNDAALSRLLEVAPPVISKLRHGALPIGPTMLIRMHEVSEMNIREMRALMLRGAEKVVEQV